MTFQLKGNYPNPFNNETALDFSIPDKGQASVEIFNINGRRVRTLANNVLSAGTYIFKWDGCDANGVAVSTGLYFYRINFENENLVGKMLLQR